MTSFKKRRCSGCRTSKPWTPP